MNTDVLSTKNIWAILCTPQSGKAFPEYVEGTRLTDETGTICVWDGPDLVKSYPAGSWSNFCEWVAVPELHRLDVIRLRDLRPALPTPAHALTTHALPAQTLPSHTLPAQTLPAL